VWHDPLQTPYKVWHNPFQTPYKVWHIHNSLTICVSPFKYLIRAIRPNTPRDMTHSYVCHDSFMFQESFTTPTLRSALSRCVASHIKKQYLQKSTIRALHLHASHIWGKKTHITLSHTCTLHCQTHAHYIVTHMHTTLTHMHTTLSHTCTLHYLHTCVSKTS